MMNFLKKHAVLLAKIMFSIIWWGLFVVALLAEIMRGLFSPVVLVQALLWCGVWSGTMLSLDKEKI